MPIRLNGSSSGRVVFADHEVSLELSVVPRCLDAELLHWSRYRIEFRTSDAALRGHSVVLTWHPYAIGVTAQASLKSESKKGIDAFVQRAARSGDASGLLADSSADPFAGSPGLTAAFAEPPGLLAPEMRGRVPRPDAFVIGMCEDYQVTWAALMESPKVRLLWERTQDRTLRFAKDPNVRVHESLIEDCYGLLALAATQALAGPVDALAGGAGGPWFGRDVGDLVEWIYKGHVNNANRRLLRGPRSFELNEDLDAPS